jgi:hypothetical protein
LVTFADEAIRGGKFGSRLTTPQYVSLGWLFGRLQKRSFGFVMLLLALVGLLRSPNDPGV